MLKTFPTLLHTLDNNFINQHVAIALEEDVGTGDVTVLSLDKPHTNTTLELQAREDLILCGMPLAIAAFKHVDPTLDINSHNHDGAFVSAGQSFATVSGNAAAILTAERTALNYLQALSSISSLTKQYVDAIADTRAKLLDTRKTWPHWRILAKYAVKCGGGHNHRMGLYDLPMVKDNHLASSNMTLAKVVTQLKAQHDYFIIECDTLEQADIALANGAPHILLDNMDLATLRQAVALNKGRAALEASGGINLDNIRDIAETGVDYISTSRITTHAPAVDIGLDYMAHS